MKLFGFLAIAVLFPSTEAIMKSRFRAAKCFSFNETLDTFKCNLKPYSRNCVTLNSVEVRKVLYEKPIEVDSSEVPIGYIYDKSRKFLKIKFKLHLRYGTIYRQVFHQEFEWCSLMDGTSSNAMTNLLMSLIRKSSPQLLETCPFLPVGLKMQFETFDWLQYFN